MRRSLRIAAVALLVLFLGSAIAGVLVGPGLIHPANLNPERMNQTTAMLARTGAQKEDFDVRAPDGVLLRGWKVRPPEPNGDWVLLFHGVSDNRTGTLGAAELLLRHHYSVVMMDARAHGRSGGNIATYGLKERFDTVAITDALLSSEHVLHLYALGVSMGAAIALQSAAVEPSIEAVVAEAPFASLREVSYDYAGLELTPLLGETLFRPASFLAMREFGRSSGVDPDEISPAKAVAQRAFPILLICDGLDRRIPCRHDQIIYNQARGDKEMWIVPGAGHAAALGTVPKDYERRVLLFLERHSEPQSGRE